MFALSRLGARDPGHAALFARRALAGAPLKVAALSTLGFAEDQAGEGKAAEQTMQFAGTRGWRDVLTQFWLMAHWMRQRRFAPSFERADALLRRADRFQPALMDSLIYVANRVPRTSPLLADRLSQDPDWRLPFLSELASDSEPASQQTDTTLLALLAKTAAPPSAKEIAALVYRFVRDKQFPEAEAAWRRFARDAPAPGQLIVDGDFDHAQGIGPFGWQLPEAVGWQALIGPAPGAGHGQALRLEYDGFSSPQPLGQLLLLPPGDYRLSGEVFRESDGQGAEPFWTVGCVQGAKPQTTSTSSAPSPVLGRWTAFDISFSIPQGCQSQWLQLAATPGDHHTDLVTWYDNLAIKPDQSISNASKPQSEQNGGRGGFSIVAPQPAG
jgi:hypothetical protein